jgi:hypothetical protein
LAFAAVRVFISDCAIGGGSIPFAAPLCTTGVWPLIDEIDIVLLLAELEH